MTWFRHASRHVHHTVANYMVEHLTALNWLNPADVPFGASVVRVVRTPAIAGEGKLEAGIGPGHVSIVLGSETPSIEEELGGPLSSQEIPLFIDIFQDSDGAAVSLACDIRDIFMGRLVDTKRSLPLINQVNQQEVAGYRMEFEDIERVTPEIRLPIPWQIVKVTAVLYFPEVRY